MSPQNPETSGLPENPEKRNTEASGVPPTPQGAGEAPIQGVADAGTTVPSPEVTTPPVDSSEPPSMLSTIIAQAQNEEQQQATKEKTLQESSTQKEQAPASEQDPKKKKRDPMTTEMILKLIGSLLLVSIIFLGSFFAYIVFHPEQANFFITVFGIDPNDVANLLKKLISSIFGILTSILAIVWIITLFRAIWIPKAQKRKKLLGFLTGGIIGVLLFSIIAFWAFLFQIINATDYTNPSGNILVYDNDLYLNDISKNISRIENFGNIIGPITLRYDLSQNAKQLKQKNNLSIESYELDFDGANCNVGTKGVISGEDPSKEGVILCTFSEQRMYTIRGSYNVKTVIGEEKDIEIPLKNVQVQGLLTIDRQTNQQGKDIITFDASKVQNLGNPEWAYSTGMYYSPNTKKIIKTTKVTESPDFEDFLIYFRIGEKKTWDRIFVISKKQKEKSIDGIIEITQDQVNSQKIIFSLTGVTLDPNLITNIEWFYNKNTRICSTSSFQKTCDFNISHYEPFQVEARISIAGSDVKIITKNFRLEPPLILERHVKIKIKGSDKIINPLETFDQKTGEFVLKDIVLPETLIFDARDILIQNRGYRISSIRWEMTDGKNPVQSFVGNTLEYAFMTSSRYTLRIDYIFEKNVKMGNENDTKHVYDTVILDLERKNLIPILFISKQSDYVPVTVDFDASTSKSENSEIKKFIFDFGEGKPETTGDARPTYRYTTAGEKTITLTIIDANNERATIKKVLVLKDTPAEIRFNSSLSPGIVNEAVDFDATETTGDVEEYIWSFGDNTPMSRGQNPSHTYTQAGEYTVQLTVKYVGGTQRSLVQKFKVVESLE